VGFDLHGQYFVVLLPDGGIHPGFVFSLLAGVDTVLAIRSLCGLVIDLFVAQASSVYG
jgi:hypothetical protein